MALPWRVMEATVKRGLVVGVEVGPAPSSPPLVARHTPPLWLGPHAAYTSQGTTPALLSKLFTG